MTTEYSQYPYCKPANDAAYSTNVSSREPVHSKWRINVSSHEPIHSKARINWFIFGSWSVMLVMCLALWAGVIAIGVKLFM